MGSGHSNNPWAPRTFGRKPTTYGYTKKQAIETMMALIEYNYDVYPCVDFDEKPILHTSRGVADFIVQRRKSKKRTIWICRIKWRNMDNPQLDDTI